MRLHPLPPLPTFAFAPSWHNRAGRTDRSACAELRPRDLLQPHKPQRHKAKPSAASFTITITARRLARIHDRRLPYQLCGDRRTTKSNAMRTQCTPQPTTNHSTIHEPCYIFGNPNKGAPRTKFLGLWHDWTQIIRIERRPRKRKRPISKPTPSRGWDHPHNPPPNYTHHFICPTCDRRVMKLFLPLCTRAEATDADAAERWLSALDAHYTALRKPFTPDLLQLRAQLINRYGPLLRPDRQLRCRHCWHIRYGEIRST